MLRRKSPALSRVPAVNHHQRRDMVAIDGSDKKLNKKTLTFCEPSSKGAITYSPAFPLVNHHRRREEVAIKKVE